MKRALGVIRETNPQRIVIVGPPQWNSAGALSTLQLPADDLRLAVTFHFYEPMQFTHQGASWIEGSTPWLGTRWQGNDAEKKVITDTFEQAAAWGRANNRPTYLGEFGSFDKGEMESRARWTHFVVQTANAKHLPWSYWEFCAGFGAYDPNSGRWHMPLLKALASGSS